LATLTAPWGYTYQVDMEGAFIACTGYETRYYGGEPPSWNVWKGECVGACQYPSQDCEQTHKEPPLAWPLGTTMPAGSFRTFECDCQ